MKIRIKSHNKQPLFLTLHKEYEVIRLVKGNPVIKNDQNMVCFCLWKNCNHIKGDWEVVADGTLKN